MRHAAAVLVGAALVAGLPVSPVVRAQGDQRAPAPLPEPASPPLIQDEPSAETHPEEVPTTPGLVWLRAEYMVWLNKRAPVPVGLVSTGLNTDQKPGVLGSGGRVVFGDDAIDFHERHGGRFTLGFALDATRTYGIEGSYYFYGDREEGRTFTSPGSTPEFPVLARPFFNVVTGSEDASVVAFPGTAGGTLVIESTNEFIGGELNGLFTIWRSGENRVELLAGARYAELREDLRITESVLMNPAAAQFPGRTILVRDVFETQNRFYGAQLGARAAFRHKRLEVEPFAKVALGATQNQTIITGSTEIDTNPATAVNAGLLALASNSGTFRRNQFTVLPEAGLNLGLHLTERWKLTFGYNFIHWDNVVRPGDQIDRRLNPRQIPTSGLFGTSGGDVAPQPRQRDTDFWVHGFSFGMQFRY